MSLIGFTSLSATAIDLVRINPVPRSSPFSVIVLSPKLVVWLVHEHAILEEHDIEDPPHAEDERQNKEELPVGPREHSNEDRDQEQVEECSLRWCVPHLMILYLLTNNYN